MRKTFILSCIMAVVALVLPSCAVNFNGIMANHSALNNYYVRNDFSDGTHRLVIHNQQDFDRVFGAAAVMGTNGQPTSIDWRHEFVIAIILPETNYQTLVENVMLNRDNDHLIYSYLVNRGHKTSYTIRPFAAVVVDRNEPSDVTFQQVTQEDLDKAGIQRTGVNGYRNVNTVNSGNGSMRPSVGR